MLLLFLLSLTVWTAHGLDSHDDLQTEVTRLALRLQWLKEQNRELKEELQQASSQIVEPVAFSAAKNSTQSVAAGDVIKFDQVFIDTHGLQNPTLGSLTIPETGIYKVSVTLYKHSSSSYNDVYADLYVGGVQLSRINNDFSSDTSATATSTSSIIRVFTVGDTLYVRAGTSGSFYGTDVYNGSKFSLKYLGPAP